MAGITDKNSFKEFLVNHHDEFVKKLNGNNTNALSQRRKEAMLDFGKQGFPTPANEEWKYTNLAAAWKNDYSVSVESDFTREDLAQHLIVDLTSNVIVVINGVYKKDLSTILDSDVFQVKNFSEIESGFLESNFGNKVVGHDSFISLNTAYADKGVFIHVSKGKIVKHPVVMYFISDTREKKPFSSIRNIVVAEENAQLILVENYLSVGTESSFVNCFTEIQLKKNARVEYYQLQNENNLSYHVRTTEVIHQDSSYFSGFTITLGGQLVRNNFNIRMNAERSESHLYGIFLADGNRHVDNHTIVDHAKANCESNELYKGILNDSSTGVFNGKIFVREDAQKTNAFQSNKNILLSPDAAMNTKPQLEIFADDVKCSHGATVGQLDEEPMFYLRSRGLSEKNAKALLTLAFAEDVIDKIKIEPLKELVRKLVSLKLQV